MSSNFLLLCWFVFQKTADLLQMLVDAERDATSKQVTDDGARTNKCMTGFLVNLFLCFCDLSMCAGDFLFNVVVYMLT